MWRLYRRCCTRRRSRGIDGEQAQGALACSLPNTPFLITFRNLHTGLGKEQEEEREEGQVGDEEDVSNDGQREDA